MSGEMTRKAIQTALKLKGRANFEDRYMKPTLGLGFVEMTIQDKPRSRMQKYRLTPAGRAVLNRAQETKVTPEKR
jgi:poly-gamma-glutamate capsule biosynthesis protein CapA/YwtB (metallophosphatase superfamily)